jgi:predicted SPOUT superfamily RNA methylase MTH1
MGCKRLGAIEARAMMRSSHSFQVGERVIFRMIKRSVHPGPRAVHVRPEPAGEGYQYEVNKFWTVSEVRDNQVVLVTRRGKTRVVDANDPALRRAGWWERLAYRGRFPTDLHAADGAPTTFA